MRPFRKIIHPEEKDQSQTLKNPKFRGGAEAKPSQEVGESSRQSGKQEHVAPQKSGSKFHMEMWSVC